MLNVRIIKKNNGSKFLRIRYGLSPEGKLVKKAEIYTCDEHGINLQGVDSSALKIIRRLRKAGFKSYIVGGAVRDLLLGIQPKDFDIATDARPRQIRLLFINSRIIGRRFRIVHIYYNSDQIIEVSTFRSLEKAASNNIYGIMEEDVWRRDFTINALLYCPFEQIIIDYIGGFEDIKRSRLRTLTPAERSFSEDPVRMIRAIKYSVQTGFLLPQALISAIKKLHGKIGDCSRERITEEIYKILQSGESTSIFYLLQRVKLLKVILPALDRLIAEREKGHSPHSLRSPLLKGLERLDNIIRQAPGKKIERGRLLACLLEDLFLKSHEYRRPGVPRQEINNFLKDLAYPLLPSIKDINSAASLLVKPRNEQHFKRGK